MKIEKLEFNKGKNFIYSEISFKKEANILQFPSKGDVFTFIDTLYYTVSNHDKITILEKEDSSSSSFAHITIGNTKMDSKLSITFEEDKRRNTYFKDLDIDWKCYLKYIILFKNIIIDRKNYIEDRVCIATKNLGQSPTIVSLLKEIFMSLDLSSVDILKEKVNSEIDKLLHEWDYQNNIPYSVNLSEDSIVVGSILEAFYAKKEAEREVKKYDDIKEEINLLIPKLRYLSERESNLEEEIEKLVEIEKDIVLQEALKKDMVEIKGEIEKLKDINDKWSYHQLSLDNKTRELIEVEYKLEKTNGQIDKLGSTDNFDNNKLYNIMKEREYTLEKLYKISAEIEILKREIVKWENCFISYDKLVDKMINKRSEQHQLEQKLDNLSIEVKLYDSMNEYYHNILSKTRELAGIESEYNLFKGILQSLEGLISEINYENLYDRLKLSEEIFIQLVTRVEHLVDISKIINKDFQRKDNPIFEHILLSFRKYLYAFADFKYDPSDKNFAINEPKILYKVISSKNHFIIAIAFRISIIDFIFDNERGIIVINDFLHTIDISKRKKVIKVISELSKKHQIIFITYHKETRNDFDKFLITQ